MNYKLIAATSNGGTDYLLLIDDKVVSRWAVLESQDFGDLCDWDNQAAAGADLSDYQDDLDAGRYDEAKVLCEQATLLDFWNKSESEVEAIWFVSTGQPAGKTLFHNTDTEDPEDYCDLNEAIEFLGDLDQYSGEVSKDGKTWAWDGKSGEPTDWHRNTIQNLKAFTK
jgi:hypothetical protein